MRAGSKEGATGAAAIKNLRKSINIFAMELKFEWNDVKARANVRKHGVSFDTAMLAFADPFVLTVQDRIEHGEVRWQTLGRVGDTHLLLVAHTILDDDLGEAGEIIRIISAREADKQEKRRYEQARD